MKSTKRTNRLINEKSPYLLQHAHNPVDWYPWGEEAFARARAEDKPVFLSVGYSTCHWCHVMERESFEDDEVAALLNNHFISVKVDREERPDIDTVYMSVCQAMTGRGGWPLTVIMTPEQKPFFAGTYFPKTGKRGLPGLMDILIQVASLWKTDREKILASSEKITAALGKAYFTPSPGEISRETLDQAYAYYLGAFDSLCGGFGKAPKFPTPHNLFFLLRYWRMSGEAKALDMVEKTLIAMYQGGIYDHIGFGFARYATDREWLAPHFEKMLYDNALLAIAYLEAYQATGQEFYARVSREIFTYALRDMTSPEGAFYSAEDADSEGEEGKFYLWSPGEVLEVLGHEEGLLFCDAYDITPRGNFEGKNIPNLIGNEPGERGKGRTANLEDLVQRFAEARHRLYLYREKRVRPFKDDKILTAWNGLMIAALSFGSRVLGHVGYAQAAEKSVAFLMQNLRREDGRLLARYRDGQAAYPAYVDDYAFLVWGLIELYQATFKPQYLAQALELNREMLKYFWDQAGGGLFQSGWDAEELVTRPKEIYDGALPSGNSVAALNFLRLARLTGDQELEKTAQAQLAAFGGTVKETPPGHAHFLTAVWFNEMPVTELSIIGDLQDPITREMLAVANKNFRPDLLLAVKLPGPEGEQLARMMPGMAGREAVGGKATAYVCRHFACQPPVTDPQDLAQ